MSFKIATWNVNSLRVRLPHVLEWLSTHKPDVLAIQETKLPDSDFPVEDIEKAGYHVVFSGQKTYNGMAILSKKPGTDVLKDIANLDDHQRRILAMTVGDVRIINLYVPNGQSVGSDKYQYKLDWLQKMTAHLKKELAQHKNVIVLGDFNVAPEDIDVHDPAAWQDQVLCSAMERKALESLMSTGLTDCFRALHPEAGAYSWWDYRLNAYKRNLGLRIDLILASADMYNICTACYIDTVPREWDRPSDHTPVMAEF